MAGSDSSESGGISRSQIFDKQQPYLGYLYKQGQRLYEDQKFQTGDTQDKLASILGQIGNISTDVSAPATQYATDLLQGNTAGMQKLNRFMYPYANGGNPYLDSVVEASIRPIEQNLYEKALPAISKQATAAGQFGGSREGVAQGLAIRETNKAIGDVSSKIRGAAYESDMNRALQAAQVYNQAQQTGAGILSSLAGQQFGQQMQQANTLLGGYAQLPQVQWAPLAMLAQIIGAPASETEALNRSQSSGFNIL